MSLEAIDAAFKIPRAGFPRPPSRKGTASDTRLVLICLAHHASDNNGHAYPARNTIAAECGLERGITSHCLQALADAGLIVDTGDRVGHGVRVWTVLPDLWLKDGPPDERVRPSQGTDRRTDRRTDGRTDQRTDRSVPNRTEGNGTNTRCDGCSRPTPTKCPIRTPGDDCALHGSGDVIDMNTRRVRVDPFGKLPTQASTA